MKSLEPHSRYYPIKNVQITTKTTLDIFILAYEPSELLRAVMLRGKGGDDVFFSSLRSELTGIARVVCYTKKQSGSEPKWIFEGEIDQGFFSGYARKINASGSCQVGFWLPFTPSNSEDAQISVPHGKWTAYNADGTAQVLEDFYVSEQDRVQKSQIQLIRISPKGLEQRLKHRDFQSPFEDYLSNADMSAPFAKAPQRLRRVFGCWGQQEGPKVYLEQ